MVAWESLSTVSARIFSAGGDPVGGPIQLWSSPNSSDTPGQIKVAGLAGGGFVAVWQYSQDTVEYTVADDDIYGRVFDASGNSVGDAFQITSRNTGFLAIRQQSRIYTNNSARFQIHSALSPTMTTRVCGPSQPNSWSFAHKRLKIASASPR